HCSTSLSPLLSLHDALPIWLVGQSVLCAACPDCASPCGLEQFQEQAARWRGHAMIESTPKSSGRVHRSMELYRRALELIPGATQDRKSTRLNSSHGSISYAV